MGDQYHYSDKPVFQALWDNYNRCQFVEDEGMSATASFMTLAEARCVGDVLFYRDKQGRAALQAAESPAIL